MCRRSEYDPVRAYELEARAHELQACTFPGGGFARPIPPSPAAGGAGGSGFIPG